MIHSRNISLILSLLLVVGLYQSEPREQEFTLDHGDRIIYWVDDEVSPTYGTVIIVWGYWRLIVSDNKSLPSPRFQDVSWIRGEL